MITIKGRIFEKTSSISDQYCLKDGYFKKYSQELEMNIKETIFQKKTIIEVVISAVYSASFKYLQLHYKRVVHIGSAVYCIRMPSENLKLKIRLHCEKTLRN